MEYFTIQDKVIAYMSDGESNLITCRDALEGKVTNTAIYRTQQTMFQQDCLYHALQGAWKAAGLGCKSEDEEGTIDVCVATVRNFFTWFKSTNKGPKSCWIETMQDVDTYKNTMGVFD